MIGMRSVRMCAIFFLFTFILTGCWDIKTIQDKNYVNAIGIDFKDGKYIVYTQIISTSSISKHEGSTSSQSATESTGHLEGVTISEAIFKLNQSSQQRIYLGHVSALLLTESALRSGLSEITDGLLRFRENRLRMRTFVTRESIDDIFATRAFHDLSPLSNILHQPLGQDDQLLSITPFDLYDVIHNYREPGNTSLIPNLRVVKEIWRKNNNPEGKLFIDGAFAIRNNNTHKWFNEKDLRGTRWLHNIGRMLIIPLVEEGRTVGTVSITNPKSTVKPIVSDDEVSFQLHIQAKAILQEMIEPLDQATLEEYTVKAIREEIERTFRIGQNAGVDILSLEHELYRKKFRDWSRLTDNGSHKLQQISLGSIEVKVKLAHTGMFNTNEQKKDY